MRGCGGAAAAVAPRRRERAGRLAAPAGARRHGKRAVASMMQCEDCVTWQQDPRSHREVPFEVSAIARALVIGDVAFPDAVCAGFFKERARSRGGGCLYHGVPGISLSGAPLHNRRTTALGVGEDGIPYE